MSYRAAISPELAVMLGHPPDIAPEPRVTCDTCCLFINVLTRHGIPSVWFMKRRNPPKWRLTWNEDGTVGAVCPACQPTPQRAGETLPLEQPRNEGQERK